jgi:hypothetical protein
MVEGSERQCAKQCGRQLTFGGKLPIELLNEQSLARWMVMSKVTVGLSLFLLLALTLLAGCGSSSAAPTTPVPLSSGNLNLIFVVSEDLAYQASGDVNPTTANLTNQGLQRSLLMATFLHQHVLGSKNVSGIYALEPMTHLQTASNYPDMAALATIQQFAVLNQVTLSSTPQGWSPFTAYSYPLNVSFAVGPVPSGVAAPMLPCPACQGLDFNDLGGDNENLLTGIVTANAPGFYVFSAPWETTSQLLANINKLEGYNLALPTSYQGPNYIYAISVAPSGSASLVTYNSNLNPPSTYPVLPSSVPVSSACTGQTPFSIAVTGGSGGAVIPAGINTNETLYMIRHAEAHPQGWWDDGNYVGAGQWRALNLPNALLGKISPNQVYSIDPAQVYPGTQTISGDSYWAYVRPSLTVEPYAIANNLPYRLVSSLEIYAPNSPQLTSEFFFNGGTFSNQKALMAWEHNHIPATVSALLSSYFPNGGGPTAPGWPSADYDSVWTVTLDATGNLKVDNATCEGINSAALPATAPQF